MGNYIPKPIDLSDVNVDTKKRIPLLLTNKLYNEHKRYGKAKKYLNIIIDEAHNILSYQSRLSEHMIHPIW